MVKEEKKELSIRVSGDDIIAVCEHIEVLGYVDNDIDSCEYVETLSVYCKSCQKYYDINILVN